MSGFLARLLSPQNATLADPPQWLVDALVGGAPSATGRQITPESAMRVATVNACVRVLAESIAQLPLLVYRRTPDGGKEEAPDHYLWPLLHDAPNARQTSFEWREMLQAHLALRGNAYNLISSVGNRVLELLPLHPDRVTVKVLPNFDLEYHVAGATRPFSSEEILHLKALSDDGVMGRTPIAQARESIGLALATEEHGARLFGNGAKPGGILAHPQKLSDEARKRLKESWDAAYSGANAYKTAVLEEGVTWTSLAMKSDDAQFLETRKFQRNEIATLFRIPPHLIGDLERATFANIEQQSLEFVVHTLMPWIIRWEQRLTASLLSARERATFFLRFKVQGLLRGDIVSRYGAYHAAIVDGWMTRNEARELEDMNPAAGLDEFLVPLNMAPASAAPDPADPADGSSPSNL